jgi:quercetin dioxygenase-like cupin family protein
MSTTTSSERTKLGYGLREEEGEDFWLFGALATIKISAEDTAGRYCVIDTEVAPGVGSPWHVHRDEDEWFFVHEGECEVYIGDAHLTLTAGGFAFGPKGVPHTFFGGPNGGKMLIWAEGGKFEGLLREIAEPAPDGGRIATAPSCGASWTTRSTCGSNAAPGGALGRRPLTRYGTPGVGCRRS